MATHVLFLCTGNSARSILSEATLRALGGDRFVAYSAGSRPTGTVNPAAVRILQAHGISTAGLASKSWDVYAGDTAPPFDLVVTVCDSAANETCPVFFGDFLRVHWGLPDPASVRGTDAVIDAAFETTWQVIHDRVAALVALPIATLPLTELANQLHDIEVRCPAVDLAAAP
jgi:arsenate reductase